MTEHLTFCFIYRFVYLDGTLHDALINRSEGYVDKLRWDQLFSRSVSNLNISKSSINVGPTACGSISEISPNIWSSCVNAGIHNWNTQYANETFLRLTFFRIPSSETTFLRRNSVSKCYLLPTAAVLLTKSFLWSVIIGEITKVIPCL